MQSRYFLIVCAKVVSLFFLSMLDNIVKYFLLEFPLVILSSLMDRVF